MQEICVIGGSRYFGKLTVERLLGAGHRVTVVNRGSTAPPAGAGHVVADRNDERALAAALGERAFDAVIDQVCYTPVQAAIAARVFGGRTRRYVMASTIEVYNPASGAVPAFSEGEPVREDAVDLATWPVHPDRPWHDMAYLEPHYGEGKRQSEAVLSHAGGFAFASVRCAHVLGGGAQEFTGRLAHYVERIARGEEVAVHDGALPSVFIHYEEMAEQMVWAATAADFTGPVNACSDGTLDARGLGAAIGAQVGREPVYRVVPPGEEASPFSFDLHFAMSNARAKRLGFSFSHIDDWLPGAVAEAVGVYSATFSAV
ncbi:NAD-dependent epimerase/dehydratase family protein [Nocardiopsis sp. RSe5-2]|uniref:NAD-dependent epimerase/dehydratase family protein n=1 Tax=Nocardiopsis endophytica TaxID=3018445 RepID=A0ABT4TXS1_9ACTN|nr:NAD-dependent epimerase/dehydratase family protein [Nocardiopsis endophytica]MDA2809485.1 NAD-dependent epimerase/dehydratase family protein [Nocardiopsis endophytica]